ncbi:carbohydrate esterase family 5 protein [Lentithecium fluviatile CBS 122367]|uniref:Carbohydrate esterase family 5 protein n=1 Tax=Lentithecium fluviatile CBS 122367 TaxID=1168545 RepID=A0A6G1JES4_9PLEO|nr:carbohydrate esterase family 5 protein [Lentithecium fluviatile CBS 122367]
MKGAISLIVLALSFLHTTTILAQCEAPVPCKDAELNRLNTTDCQTYHAFIARGSDSGYPGHLGGLIKLICHNFTSEDSETTCGYENIVYPANSTAWGKDAWCKSATIGAEAGQAQMKAYAERCLDAKLIVLGFSQGGSVVLDVLGGGGGEVFECVQGDTPAMDRSTAPGSNVVAATVFGAVRRSPSQPYSLKGGRNYSGTASRSAAQLAGLAPYADILRDYCNQGDPICAVGSEPVDVARHLDYFELYNEEAKDFVVRTARGERVGVGEEEEGNGTASGTEVTRASGTPTPSATQWNSQEAQGGASVGRSVNMIVIGGAFGAMMLL